MVSQILNRKFPSEWLSRSVDITGITLSCSGLLMIYGISDSIMRAVDTQQDRDRLFDQLTESPASS